MSRSEVSVTHPALSHFTFFIDTLYLGACPLGQTAYTENTSDLFPTPWIWNYRQCRGSLWFWGVLTSSPHACLTSNLSKEYLPYAWTGHFWGHESDLNTFSRIILVPKAEGLLTQSDQVPTAALQDQQVSECDPCRVEAAGLLRACSISLELTW